MKDKFEEMTQENNKRHLDEAYDKKAREIADRDIESRIMGQVKKKCLNQEQNTS